MSKRTSHDPVAPVKRGGRARITVDDILCVAGSIRGRFARSDFAAADLDDVEQNATLEMLETIRKGRLQRTGNYRGFLYRAGVRRAGLEASRMLAAVSISEGVARTARHFQVRVQVDGCGADPDLEPVVDLACESTRDDERDRVYMMRRLRAIVATHIASLSQDERRAADMLLGLTADAASGPAEVVWRTGISHATIRRAIKKLTVAVRSDSVIEQQEAS